MSSKISQKLDKKNLHHAYLIEGAETQEVLKLMEELGIETSGNPDFIHLSYDTLKIDDARYLKSESSEKSSKEGKKIFVISANSILTEAQNTMLKMFEEPGEGTHFFVLVPDVHSLLPTFISRFYVIHSDNDQSSKEAQEFLKLTPSARIEFLKGLLEEDEEEGSISGRSKAMHFLNSLEAVLHAKIFASKKIEMNTEFFSQIFNAREFLRMSGSSVKNLMESLALSIPRISI